ncbi:RNA polymerase sigma factor [Streptomyces sioyaensis]|uniref:RNA polymerase sigma factor n=1 Tax=Streptomyces sioyaensis TaxID=67364 RepID=UPI003D7503DF
MMEALSRRRGEGWNLATDDELIEATRKGDMEAFGELWVRYEKSAARVASRLTRSSVDDIVSESFARILRCLCAGKGPQKNFRAYLFATIRSLVIDTNRLKSGKAVPVGDEEQLAYLAGTTVEPEPGEVAEIARASWDSLNERDKWLMWTSAVQGYSTPEIGTQLGITSAKAAVWLYRARERMRDAFLATHIPVTDDPVCAAQRRRFAKYLQNKISDASSTALTRHLAECAPCADAFVAARDVNHRMRTAVFPLLSPRTKPVCDSTRSGRPAAAA